MSFFNIDEYFCFNKYIVESNFKRETILSLLIVQEFFSVKIKLKILLSDKSFAHILLAYFQYSDWELRATEFLEEEKFKAVLTWRFPF